MSRSRNSFLALLLHILPLFTEAIYEEYTPVHGQNGTKCYDDFHRPQRCIPAFENPAFNHLIDVTNTCGDNGPIEYCVQTGITGLRKACDMCYPGQHAPHYLTDDSKDTQTWWQSETINEGMQYPNEVNLTLNLGKAFDITYVRIWFHSPRPESFAIYKRVCETCPWIPYQYYSATCRDTYGLPDSTKIFKGDETRALCTSEYSDISPLRDGNIAFATLEYRPSANRFDTSPELQEWVTATDIRITLNRMNTFGDEVFGDVQVLRSYFYAIVEISIGARCKCNGHASECVVSSSIDGTERRVCKCEHNTAGPDCNECLPFYNDAPWRRASEKNAHECKPCNCNGFSQRCYFDAELYSATGHGGHCLDCTANRDGPNCERCKENYYHREDQYCIACGCDAVGSRSLQCNSEGKCQCKPGVTGEKCDRCEVNYYDFGPEGCKSCGCNEAGISKIIPNCHPSTGVCSCKENVEGKRCRECKPGFFNLDKSNDFGCTPCFCYGHSSQCTSAVGYSKYQIESSFTKSPERWRVQDRFEQSVDLMHTPGVNRIGVLAPGGEPLYFLAPDKYLGDQRASYNQLLTFKLQVGENRATPRSNDIILEGAGTSISSTIFAQDNPLPTTHTQEYKFRMNENYIYGWSPRLSARAFMSILTNLTAIKIRATYTDKGIGFLEYFKLETASRGVGGEPALWVEQCTCPAGYVGQFCESCEPGYRHYPSIGPFMQCTPCDCNKHADICESESGRCICQHNTTGNNCEKCARGFYGNALGGTSNDCQPCGCPNGGACIQMDEDIVCVECPVGYTGAKCDVCSDGFYGDPRGYLGVEVPCQPCECNLNIDPNAIANCNTTTGECLKCIHNTGGPRCDTCLPGFYGDALALPKGDCQPCRCYPPGTVEGIDGAPLCDQISGTCNCKNHVQGRNCDECEEGYYNIVNGEGCISCGCDPIGSVNQTCNIQTGQCYCQPGVTGLRCDQCEPHKYGFSGEGCKSCDCDYIGSKDLQCDSFGQCPCLDNVEGRRCDRCKENKHDRQRGCVDCPDCYNLVQDGSRKHASKLQQLKTILDEIERNPTVIDDEKFEEQLHDIQDDVEDLSEQAQQNMGIDEKTLMEKLDDITEQQKEIVRTLEDIEENILLAKEQDSLAHQNITHTDENLKAADEILDRALDALAKDGAAALEKATERAKVFGQHNDNMTKIAHEARKLADELDEQAEEIMSTAASAKNKSTTAYELAKNATDQQKNITLEIRYLRSEVAGTDNKLNRVKQLTEDAHKKSLENKNKALALLSEVKNLVMPETDIAKLKLEADATRNESKALIEEAEELIDENEKLLRDIDEQIISAGDLLSRALEQHDVGSELLSEIDLAKAQAVNAVTLGDKTLNDAKAMYETLSKFDQQVKESKEAAQQALNQIPEIEDLIRQAEDDNKEAEGSLDIAKDNADNALERATDAGELAKQATDLAEAIEKEAELLSKNATNLKIEAEFMADRVDNTEIEFRKLAKQTENNATLINEVREKVGQAQKDSEEATRKVNEILRDVEAIMRELENVSGIDEDELNRLEMELKRAEQRVKDENLEEIIKQLQKEQRDQNALVEEHNEEIRRLRKDVENIEQIAKALPNKCFRKYVLEP